MDRFRKDMQYAVRTLLKRPGFTIVVLLLLTCFSGGMHLVLGQQAQSVLS